MLCVRCAEITADLATSTGISFKNVVGRVSGTALTRDQMARDLIGCGPVTLTLTLTLTLTHDDQQGGRPVGGTNPNP